MFSIYCASIEKTRTKHKPRTTLFLAIVGGSGSGKTWLAEQIAQALPGRASRLSLDDFYRDRSHLPPGRRSRCNFDKPEAIDWAEFEKVLTALAAGKTASVPCYDFKTHCRTGSPKAILPSLVVIVDGLWLLHRPTIRRMFAVKVFLECPGATRLKRRLDRDTQVRGRTAASIRRQFRETVEPMHRRFVEPQKRFADIVVGTDTSSATQVMVDMLNAQFLGA